MQILHHTTTHPILYISCHYRKVSIHPSTSSWFIFVHDTWRHIWVFIEPIIGCLDKDLFVVRCHVHIIRALSQILSWVIVTPGGTTWIMIKLTPFNVFTRYRFEFIIPKLHTMKVTIKNKNKLIKITINVLIHIKKRKKISLTRLLDAHADLRKKHNNI